MGVKEGRLLESRSTPYISHLTVATEPTITIRGWLPFASALLEPKRCATSGNDKSARGILIGIATYQLPGARSPPPHPLIPEYHPYTHRRHHRHPLAPFKHAQASLQVRTCLQCVIRSACTRILLSPPRRLPPLPSLFPFTFSLARALPLSPARTGSGRRCHPPAAESGSAGAAALRGGGPPWLRSTTSRRAPGRRPTRSRAPPGWLQQRLTPASSCAAIPPSPLQTGPPPGVLGRPLLPAPRTTAPFRGEGREARSVPEQGPGASSRSPHPSPARRPAPRAGHQDARIPGGAGGGSLQSPPQASPTSGRRTASGAPPQRRSQGSDPPSWRASPRGSPPRGRGGKQWPSAPAGMRCTGR